MRGHVASWLNAGSADPKTPSGLRLPLLLGVRGVSAKSSQGRGGCGSRSGQRSVHLNRTFSTRVLAALLACAAGLASCEPASTPVPATSPAPPTQAPPPTEAAPPTPEPPAADLTRLVVEAELPPYDPIAWKLALGLVEGPVERTNADPPSYAEGSVASFFVTDEQSETGYRQLEAELLYMNDTVGMWVELGIEVDRAALRDAADRFASEIVPTVRSIFGQEWSPGVDNDPRLSILHVPFLKYASGQFDPIDEYPQEFEPYSNQREMFYVSLADFEVGDPQYMATLAHEFQHMIQWNTGSSAGYWLFEGLAQLAERLAGFDLVANDAEFLAKTGTQLNAWSASPTENLPYYGASYLFSLYLWEQWGEDLIRELARHPLGGMAAVRQILAARGTDLDAVFADWTVANLLDDPSLMGGRFGYTQERLRPACPRIRVSELPFEFEGTLAQYSAQYLIMDGTGQIELEFQGLPEVGAIADSAHSGDRFWWSNRGDNSHMTLTRAFDLTGLEAATLEYWTWYDIEPFADFGYITISGDGGESWEFLEGEAMAFDREFDFGPNYTGVSGGGVAPEWVEDRIDLSAYIGGEVLVRFEYVTQTSFTGYGWAIDDIALPELGYQHDAEADAGGWEGHGFVRTPQALKQKWALHLVQPGEVRRLEVGEDGLARASLSLAPDQDAATLVVAAMAPRTKVEASYRLSLAGSASLSARPETAPGLAYQDDFSDLCSGWGIDETSDYAYGYQDGKFFMDLPVPNVVAVSNAGLSFVDAMIEVDTAQDSTAGDNIWGVICRYLDFDNYYEFDISNDGYFAIFALLDGEFVPLQDWTPTQSIGSGDGATNQLAVSCVGETLSLAVNGVQLASVTDSRLTTGDIGFTAGTYETGGARITFDDLRVATPDYAQLEGVLLFDDFSDPASGWDEHRDAEFVLGYQEGSYFIEITAENRLEWSSAFLDAADVDVQVDTVLESPTVDNSWGVFCRYRDVDNYYALEIGSDGLFTIYAIVAGQYVTLADWTYSDAIATGEGAENHIRVRCVGQTLSLTVNGVLLAEVEDASLSGGDVALTSSTYTVGGSRVTFDNLVVWQP